MGRFASQTQGGQTVGFNLDPAGRTRETVSTGTKTSDLLSNYAGPGSSPSWSENKPNGETTRNIPGIDGQLAAIQYNSEAPTLQLANLHGDIIATAYLSETATELESKSDTSEFGVPTNGLPPKYSWLGAIEVQTTELPSGVISMGARSYVPQLGRFLQPDPIPGGSANAYGYTFGDPVNSSDPSGEYTWGVSSSLFASDDQAAQEVAAREVAREEAERRAAEEAAARLAAEQAAYEAAWAAESAAGPQYAEEWEEWEEEGGEYEYAADHQEGSGKGESHVESATLIQPLGEMASEGGLKEVRGEEDPGYSVPVACPSLKDACAKQVRHHSGKANEGACKSRTNGQGCGAGGANEGLKNACDVAGVFISLAGFPESVPPNVAKIIAGGGAAAAAACRQLAG